MAGRVRRILVANRGEIAVRIIRACRELGIEVVQAYSEADRESLPVKLADRAVCIGHARAADSYLNARTLVAAAIAFKADAIHPGYGFLSENADFADLCARESVIFIGPTAAVIRKMGDKAMARRLAAEAGVPTTPGSNGIIANAKEAAAVAERIGYPVLLKAAAGGGGRGMRVVWEQKELEGAFQEAAREAKASFGDGSIYVERFLTEIRHIEIQVLGDGQRVLNLGERDCSTQRRNQKLIEESPSPVLGPKLRSRIGEAAVRLAQHVGYTSAGTIECILDEKANEFYFMEMNTRIQVEHPVTEMMTGIDLVKSQILVAAGESLDIAQKDVKLQGHAIECRINAEDEDNDFMPNPGRISHYQAPGGPGVRVDSHLYAGYVIPPYYDSLLGKLICWGRNRDESISRMQRALNELVVEGVKTNTAFHQRLLAHEDFRMGRVHTRYVQEKFLKSQ